MLIAGFFMGLFFLTDFGVANVSSDSAGYIFFVSWSDYNYQFTIFNKIL